MRRHEALACILTLATCANVVVSTDGGNTVDERKSKDVDQKSWITSRFLREIADVRSGSSHLSRPKTLSSTTTSGTLLSRTTLHDATSTTMLLASNTTGSPLRTHTWTSPVHSHFSQQSNLSSTLSLTTTTTITSGTTSTTSSTSISATQHESRTTSTTTATTTAARALISHASTITSMIAQADTTTVSVITSTTATRALSMLKTPSTIDAGLLGGRMAPRTPAGLSPFHCHAMVPEAWDPGKLLYCCEAFGIGPSCWMSTTHPAASTSVTASSTAVGSNPGTVAMLMSSLRQSRASTTHVLTGDATASAGTSTREAYNCTIGFSSWQTVWTESKITYCCRHSNRGCTTTSTTTASPFNCNIAEANWTKAWSAEKRSFCCESIAVGCEADANISSSDTLLTFNCRAGFANWKRGWSRAKSEYCCQKYSVACPQTTSTTTSTVSSTTGFDCNSSLDKTWHYAKRDWCCQMYGQGCADAVEPFNCSVGYSQWEFLWTADKQEWCCRIHKLACPTLPQTTSTTSTTTATLFFDCKTDYIQRQTAWSSIKKSWCCAHYLLGCSSNYTEPFDCLAGFANWHNSWSHQKKRWCCRHHFHGCGADLWNVTTTTTSEPFDCDEGLTDGGKGWSHFKKEFCCRTHQRGCRDVERAIDDATMTIIRCGHPENVTLSSKEALWCCKHAQINCPQQITIAQKFESIRARALDLKPVVLPSFVGTLALLAALASSYGCKWSSRRGTNGHERGDYLYTKVAVTDPDTC